MRGFSVFQFDAVVELVGGNGLPEVSQVRVPAPSAQGLRAQVRRAMLLRAFPKGT